MARMRSKLHVRRASIPKTGQNVIGTHEIKNILRPTAAESNYDLCLKGGLLICNRDVEKFKLFEKGKSADYSSCYENFLIRSSAYVDTLSVYELPILLSRYHFTPWSNDFFFVSVPTFSLGRAALIKYPALIKYLTVDDFCHRSCIDNAEATLGTSK
jgi:hypothetical protein